MGGTLKFYLSSKVLKTPTPSLAKNPVIVKKSSPKNLSAVCRPTVGRQSADSLPTG